MLSNEDLEANVAGIQETLERVCSNAMACCGGAHADGPVPHSLHTPCTCIVYYA